MDTRRRGGVARVSDEARRCGVCRETNVVLVLAEGLVHRDNDNDDLAAEEGIPSWWETTKFMPWWFLLSCPCPLLPTSSSSSFSSIECDTGIQLEESEKWDDLLLVSSVSFTSLILGRTMRLRRQWVAALSACRATVRTWGEEEAPEWGFCCSCLLPWLSMILKYWSKGDASCMMMMMVVVVQSTCTVRNYRRENCWS